MNISFNINAANLVGGLKGGQKVAGKSLTESGSDTQSSGASSSSETFEVSGKQSQEQSNQSTPIPAITDTPAAENQAVFLKNVIIALPALVLRAQGNLTQQSAVKLLQ